MNRADQLLIACKDLFEKLDESPYVLNAFEQQVNYDGVDCDGYCLFDDIKSYLECEMNVEEVITPNTQSLLNTHGEYVCQFAKNHGITTSEAYEHPMVKAHYEYCEKNNLLNVNALRSAT